MLGAAFSWLSSAVSGLLGSLFQWAGVIGAYFLGRRSAQKAQARWAAKVKDKQLEIAAKPPAHRRSMLDRMYKRKRGN